PFEAALMCNVEQDLCKERIVLDNQHNLVAKLNIAAVISHFDNFAEVWRVVCHFCFSASLGERHTSAILCWTLVLAHPLLCYGSVSARQIKREGAAFAWRRDDAYFATQQARNLATDRKSQARAAIFAAGRTVRLLERFEDDPLFLDRNADASVSYRKGND